MSIKIYVKYVKNNRDFHTTKLNLPTGALDSKNSIAVVKLLLDVRKRLNCPVMTITHNPEMARVADRIFHMKDGELIRIEDNEAPCTAEELDW